MATRALIIGKDKNGNYRYGQSFINGYQNTAWLQKHMSNPDEVEKFLIKLTEGGEDGDGHGIHSLFYEDSNETDTYDFQGHTITVNRPDYNKPFVKWDECSYNSGIAKSLEEMLQLLQPEKDLGLIHLKNFDFPEYISYWTGEKWVGTGDKDCLEYKDAELIDDSECRKGEFWEDSAYLFQEIIKNN